MVKLLRCLLSITICRTASAFTFGKNCFLTNKSQGFVKMSILTATTTSLPIDNVETSNPLLLPFDKYDHGIPPFNEINPSHFKPALDSAFLEHLKELHAIVDDPSDATFDNTIASFDRSGSLLNKVAKVYYNLCSSMNPPDLQACQTEMAAPLAAHRSATYLLPGLFNRIDKVYEDRRTQSYNTEELRLIERIHLDFVRAGARFDTAAKARYGKLMEELAELTTKFTQVINRIVTISD